MEDRTEYMHGSFKMRKRSENSILKILLMVVAALVKWKPSRKKSGFTAGGLTTLILKLTVLCDFILAKIHIHVPLKKVQFLLPSLPSFGLLLHHALQFAGSIMVRVPVSWPHHIS